MLPESQKEPGSMTSKTHHAALGPVMGAVLCAPPRHQGHNLGVRVEVTVKLWVNLCQGRPKKTLRDASERGGKKGSGVCMVAREDEIGLLLRFS